MRNTFKKTSNNVCTLTVVVSPDPLPPTPKYRYPERLQYPDGPEPGDKEDNQT
jgi:hypothetical protein